MILEYLDTYGLPGAITATKTLDMGDCCADYFTILALSDEAPDRLRLFWDDEHRVPVRHPDRSQWWGQPNRLSRDQLIPMLVYGILKGKCQLLVDTVVSHMKHGFLFAWNTRQNGAIEEPWKVPDITGLEVWGLWLRVFKPIGYKLLLPVCDLETLVNALLWKYYQPKTNRLTRNALLVAIAQREIPSIISHISDKINDYNDLLNRWEENTQLCGEYPTGPLMRKALE